ncbi:MAG: 1-acyl-sn-glycerol-3-phosphate acyltransferase [Candidatus Competibacteraceae bacterium]|nr:1-acyl-sn-glycerol-3-phosphate acyltransferase [Candidatus Competibacteraceae bacterium]
MAAVWLAVPSGGDPRSSAARSDGATEAIEQLVWRLRRGERVLVFPEGTSTIGESVRRFHPRLFKAALLAHAARCRPSLCVIPRRDEPTRPCAPLSTMRSCRICGGLLGEPAIRVELFGEVYFSAFLSGCISQANLQRSMSFYRNVTGGSDSKPYDLQTAVRPLKPLALALFSK